ncbi:MAG: ABC transporter ATP-binding protein [Candidatus Edwardsbacteria bacterium]|nr:ABC transporter ATP-binding protein [Candidatus Edwardsbacteria bacterium]
MLKVRGLEVRYGQIRALGGVSFDVPRGKIVTLIGANGAGKSTALRTLSGLIRADRGSISFKGKEITNAEAHAIVALGISHVPEGRRIFPTLSVRENLELAGWVVKDQSAKRQRIGEVFQLFPRLRERLGQLGGTLSGGEQQMLAVARALVSGGELMLLDEPSMGLSPVLAEEIFRTIRKINAAGTTILLVEQNARKALEIADYAYVLEVGAVALEGPAAQLAADPRVREAYLGI